MCSSDLDLPQPLGPVSAVTPAAGTCRETWRRDRDKVFLANMAFVPGDTIKALLCALIVHTVARALPDWPFPGSESRTAHR